MGIELKDILANSNKDIDNQQLMDYLSKQLSKSASHDIEKYMAEDEFINDAVEGLQQINSKKDLPAYVEQLNDDLRKQIAKNRERKDKRRLKDQPYIYLTIFLILILLVVSFFVLKRYSKPKPVNHIITGELPKQKYQTGYYTVSSWF